MKNIHVQERNKKWIVIALVLSILFFTPSALNAQFLPPDKIRNDFRNLLQRTAVAPKASIQSFLTDSVLIEKGYFYSEADEKVPLLIYKPVSNKKKIACSHLSS